MGTVAYMSPEPVREEDLAHPHGPGAMMNMKLDGLSGADNP
jgi:hypothetical protein